MKLSQKGQTSYGNSYILSLLLKSAKKNELSFNKFKKTTLVPHTYLT